MFERRVALTIAAVMVFGAIIVPATSAQGTTSAPAPDFSFSIENIPAGSLTPLEAYQFKIEGRYTMKTSVQAAGTLQGSPIATFDVQCPQEITITGATTAVIPIQSQPGTTAPDVSFDVPLYVSISREALARQQLTCTVDGSVSSPNAQTLPSPEDFSSNFVVSAEYFSLVEAKTDVKLKQGGPQKQIPFTLAITNFGNGETKINFATTTDPGGKWQGLAPDVLLLDPKGGTRESSDVVYTVVTPFKNGWNNEEGAFTITLKPEYSFDNTLLGSELSITVVARVRGVYVPSLEPMVMVGAVIGTALVARMMREE